MEFATEKEFEDALINLLKPHGWKDEVFEYPSEQTLINNWKDIIFANNRGVTKLNGIPLSESEMNQILSQVRFLATPYNLNSFINGKQVTIKRDNPDAGEDVGKNIVLDIFDKLSISGGSSKYQIARQPRFTRGYYDKARRGDVMLLINGMPVIHIELKNHGVPVSNACNQIKHYSERGVFSGIFSLVQIFVAMTPEETVYFANPGPGGVFNNKFYFHWADSHNTVINDWRDIVVSLLNIPMAHQLIGFYSVSDRNDGIFKVMRSYQIYAAAAIDAAVKANRWQDGNQRGGFVWHTTGSGKTLTSYKSAMIVAESKNADKVVFLVDRVELDTQSLKRYRGFAGDDDMVQGTDDTDVLIAKLKSNTVENRLIVTSINKMSNIVSDGSVSRKNDIRIINQKRMVVIVDEAHRTTFGKMMIDIKDTFPNALFFGFTGTPILIENEKKGCTTSDVFGNELHRYNLADGIKDGNVLGFDLYKVRTFDDDEARTEVALYKARAKTIEEALSDPTKKKTFLKFMDKSKIKMYKYKNEKGKYVLGIEDYLKPIYKESTHKNAVVDDFLQYFPKASLNGKFHAIFATSSISDALDYYNILKTRNSNLRFTVLIDPSQNGIDDDDEEGRMTWFEKEEALKSILEDYEHNYGLHFALSQYKIFSKDVAARLSHEDSYQLIEKDKSKQLDFIIVVNRMLTGYDSKWVNALYLDKFMTYEYIIQAFSRTNRIFGAEKPFGIIRYYKMPHSMEIEIQKAVKLYSENRDVVLFVNKIERNIIDINSIYHQIETVFLNEGIKNFEHLPDSDKARGEFANLFKQLNDKLEAAMIQGLRWNKSTYEGEDGCTVVLELSESTYQVLKLRYKELYDESVGGDGIDSVPFDLDPHIADSGSVLIDSHYMEEAFIKFRKKYQEANSELLKEVLLSIHQWYAMLSIEDQKYADIFISDLRNRRVELSADKTLMDYINEYKADVENDNIKKIVATLGVDEAKLRKIMLQYSTKDTIYKDGQFEELKSTIKTDLAIKYFSHKLGHALTPRNARIEAAEMLKEFILSGSFEISG